MNKRNETEILQEVIEYIGKTYTQHYEGENGVNAIDVWVALGSLETTARDTAIKYLMRYGKKDGKNEKDLLKAIHYIVLMISAARESNRTQTPKSDADANVADYLSLPRTYNTVDQGSENGRPPYMSDYNLYNPYDLNEQRKKAVQKAIDDFDRVTNNVDPATEKKLRHKRAAEEQRKGRFGTD